MVFWAFIFIAVLSNFFLNIYVARSSSAIIILNPVYHFLVPVVISGAVILTARAPHKRVFRGTTFITVAFRIDL